MTFLSVLRIMEKAEDPDFLGDAHASSLIEICNCRATLGRTGEGPRPHVGIADPAPDI
jgi:hypothetical protein